MLRLFWWMLTSQFHSLQLDCELTFVPPKVEHRNVAVLCLAARHTAENEAIPQLGSCAGNTLAAGTKGGWLQGILQSCHSITRQRGIKA